MKKDTYLVITIIAVIIFAVYLFDFARMYVPGAARTISGIAADLIMMLIMGGIAYYCYEKYQITP
jgi:hypothetical protein